MNDLMKSLDLWCSPEKGSGAFPVVPPPIVIWIAGGPVPVVVTLAAA